MKKTMKMSKYLIVEFKDACLIRSHKKTKDKIFDPIGLGDKVDRDITNEFVEPITTQQISNMLHVLFGERPKPMNRTTVYNRTEYLYEKAKDCFIKIDNFKDKNNDYQSEIFQTNKPFWNSWQKTSYMNWNRVHKLLEDEHFKLFTDTIKEVYNETPDTIIFNDLAEKIKKDQDLRIMGVFKFLNSNGKTPLYDWVFGNEGQKSSVNMNKRTRLTIMRGIDRKISLNGSIIIPVNEEDIIRIKNSRGCATLLDGGAVFIKGINNNISTHGYIRVGDICMAKRELPIKK